MDVASFSASSPASANCLGAGSDDSGLLDGGRDWWSQIEDALKSKPLQHFVLVVTPAALASPVVRREIRLARQEGKTVSPIKGPGLTDLGKLPRWLGQVYDLDVPEHRTT